MRPALRMRDAIVVVASVVVVVVIVVGTNMAEG
jgi:hypothetical protein